MNKNGFILVIIDIILVVIVVILAIWFSITDYSNTLGSLIHAF